MHITKTLIVSAMLAASAASFAHGDKEHAKGAAPMKMEQKEWGIGGHSNAVKRTVEIRMTDNMRFTPDLVEVKQGETIRFVHVNNGKVMHEFVLGTRKELDEHAALMKKFPNMEHDEPYMAHVGAGKKGEIVWNFNKVGEFDFACLLPGHYEAGMVGKIKVVAK
ncbi:cupredoxin family protein [Hydrogenophaga sp.]|uniref:cupredoxin domain-containing protein n=1 Tax=Hydrogenophaga sp. TaxID=1904254 RepID=UPI0025C208F2|nr:cupredoxin family protein [Hydrogenophaga sp.]MBT9463448.1 cupredoxin family protein [Hydrogenophaga sp.]